MSTQHAAVGPLDTLPTELIRQTFSYIDDLRTQLSLSRTCKQFHDALEAAVYSIIELTNPTSLYLLSLTLLQSPPKAKHLRHLSLPHNPHRRPFTKRPPISESLYTARKEVFQRFFKLCQADTTYLQEHHQRLVLNRPYYPNEPDSGGLVLASSLILLLCRNLQILEFNYEIVGGQHLMSTLKHIEQLQRLRFGSSDYGSTTLQEISLHFEEDDETHRGDQLSDLISILRMPSLEKVTCTNLNGLGLPYEYILHQYLEPPTTLSNVSELNLLNIKVNGFQLDSITRSIPKLKTLDISLQDLSSSGYAEEISGIISAFLCLAPTLESLTFTDLGHGKVLKSVNPALPSFSPFSKLTSLTIPAWILDALFFSPDSLSLLPHVFNFSIFPPNLEDLTLSDVDGSALALLRVLSDHELVVRLEKLEILHIELAESVWRDYRQLERGCREFVGVFAEMGVSFSVDSSKAERKAGEMEGGIVVRYH